MPNVKSYLKALAAGVVAAVAFLAPVVDDGLTTSEALLGVSAFLVGTGVVYAVPNKPVEPSRREAPAGAGPLDEDDTYGPYRGV